MSSDAQDPSEGDGETGQGGKQSRAFSFNTWFRGAFADLAAMAVTGLVGLIVYAVKPAPSRHFPITFNDGTIVYPQYAYPLRTEIIPIWLAAILAFTVPFATFALIQRRLKNTAHFLDTTVGLLQSLVTAATLQVFLKWLIGGFRPHFLSVCKPKITTPGEGAGFQRIMYRPEEVCTGNIHDVYDSLESFPSGHSTAAFAGFVYLSLYLNAQLKIMSDHRPAYWKVLAFFAPLLGATLIAGALTIDQFHHYYDVMAGAFIGTFTAFVCYRATFAAVVDFRFNHVTLPRPLPGLPAEDQRFSYTIKDARKQTPYTSEAHWRGADSDTPHTNIPDEYRD